MFGLRSPVPEGPVAYYREDDKHIRCTKRRNEPQITNYKSRKQACVTRLRVQLVTEITNAVCRMAQVTNLKCQKTTLYVHTLNYALNMYDGGGGRGSVREGGLNMVSDICITVTAQRYQSFFATC